MAKFTGQTSSFTSVGQVKTAPPQRAEQPSAGAATAILVEVAEELGRLLARQELARTKRRRGYSLPELLIAALIIVVLELMMFKM